MKFDKKSIRKDVERHPFLSCFVFAILLDLIIELLSRRSAIGLVAFVIGKPHIFALNVCIVLASLMIVFFFRRRYFAGLVIGVVWLSMGLVDFALLSFRTTPFSWADITVLQDGLAVADSYIHWWGAIGLLILTTGVLLVLIQAFRKLPRTEKRVRRLHALVRLGLAVFGVYGISVAMVRTEQIEDRFPNIAQAYQDYGFAYCFMNSCINTGISKPEDYTEESVENIEQNAIVPQNDTDLELFQKENVKGYLINSGVESSRETPNIIFLQLESFSDPTLYRHVELSEDPIPFFHSLMEEYSSGFVSVPSVGAGTANTEFEMITGMNLDYFGAGEYPYKTVLKDSVCESMCYDLKELDYHAIAIHNNTGYFYDRNSVYSKLGFDIFIPLEYMRGYEYTPTGWTKDNILTEQIQDAMDSTVGADYIYTVSVQGHGSYPEENVLGDSPVKVMGLNTEDTNAMEYYLAQIREMDMFLEELVAALETRDEPTVLVIYGDHLPALDLSEDKLENEDQYQTEYVIWSNFDMQKEDRDLESYQLGAMVLARLGISSGTMVRYHQNYLAEDSHTNEENEEYLRDMGTLEYDVLYGDHIIYDGKSPFVPTKLHMGLEEIDITACSQKGQGLIVEGKNFTPSSVVVINDQELETVYFSENTLYVPLFEPTQERNEVTIRQVMEGQAAMGENGFFVLYAEYE